MKIAIMQPYFFPYLGYFQLLHIVDAFVIYDDVNYIKQGWINRNNILIKGKSQLITLQLKNASSFRQIRHINLGENKLKLLTTIKQTYAKAPYRSDVFSLLDLIFNNQEKNLAQFLVNSLEIVCSYLDIKTPLFISSLIPKDPLLHGQERVLSICNEMGGTHYINLPGGKTLYKKDEFAKAGIQLSFIKPNLSAYHQNAVQFIPSLSIIDIMLFNSKSEIKGMLNEYEIE